MDAAVDAKLAQWTELYRQLREAQARLNEHRAAKTGDPETLAKLRGEVQRLEREAALAAVQVAFAAMKKESTPTKP